MEKRSTHPLAQAVLNAAKAHDVLDQYAPAADVAVLAGRGVQGQVDGRLVTVGSHHLFENEYPHPKDLCAKIDSAEAQGQTAMLLSDGDRVRGYIAVADEPRESSAAVVRDLNTLGLTTVMLTGDNARAADSIGQAVGVRDVRANLMPEDKVDAVQGLLRQQERLQASREDPS